MFRMLVNKWQNTRVPITLLRTNIHNTRKVAFTITFKIHTHTQADRTNENQTNERSNEMKEKKERTKKC